MNIPKGAHIVERVHYLVNVWSKDAWTGFAHELGTVECVNDVWSDGYDEWHFVAVDHYSCHRAEKENALKGFFPWCYFSPRVADELGIAQLYWFTDKVNKED